MNERTVVELVKSVKKDLSHLIESSDSASEIDDESSKIQQNALKIVRH